MNKRTVLVIGGGGHQITYQLRKDAQVTPGGPKTYWEVPMAVPRLLVEVSALAARPRSDSFLGMTRHFQGKVSSLADGSGQIKLNDGNELTVHVEYAVISSGDR